MAETEIGLYDVMGFGEHRNVPCIDVIDKHPDYIKWMITQTDRVLSNEAYRYYVDNHGVPE